MYYVKLYLLTVPVFFVIDLVWLGVVARRFYRSQLGSLLRAEVNWGAAAAFYLLYIAGILVFVTAPALEKGSLGKALVYGAFFGLITYATYDLTNLATLEGWPVPVVIVDILWGAILCAAVGSASYGLGRWLA